MIFVHSHSFFGGVLEYTYLQDYIAKNKAPPARLPGLGNGRDL